MQIQTEGWAWPEAYKGVAGRKRNSTLEDTNSDVLSEESGETTLTVNFFSFRKDVLLSYQQERDTKVASGEQGGLCSLRAGINSVFSFPHLLSFSSSFRLSFFKFH